MRLSKLFTILRSDPHKWRSYVRSLARSFHYGNIDYHMLRGFSFPPLSVCFILTEKCNLKCKMCDIGRRNAGGCAEGSHLVSSLHEGTEWMGLDNWVSVSRELAGFRPRPLILLTGTEPLLYDELLPLFAEITACGLPAHITTNGTLLPRIGPGLVSRCRKSADVSITVSIDDIGEAHDEIRGVPGTFSRAVDGIRTTAAAREERGLAFPSIHVTCTLSQYNYTNIDSFVQWFVDQNVPIDSITFNHLWFKNSEIVDAHNSHAPAQYRIRSENIDGIAIREIDAPLIVERIHALRKKYALPIHQMPELTLQEAKLYYSSPCTPVFYDRCTAPWRNVSITPHGNVILSPLCFFAPAGNVLTESFKALWNGKSLRHLRRHLKKAHMYPGCSRCCMLFGSKPSYYKAKQRLM